MTTLAEEALKTLNLPTGDQRREESPHRFADGGGFRFEIPSVGGPLVMESVIDEARRLEVPVHRVSEGSGIQLLTDQDILATARLGVAEHLEVSLFLGPRAGFEPSAMRAAPNGGLVRPRLRGMDGIRAALDDALRAYDLGIRSVLVTDEGLLWLHQALRNQGIWPQDLKIKGSVMMGASSPLSIQTLASMGVSIYNYPTGPTVEQLATIRQVTDLPLDLYVDSPDDAGGFIRYSELAPFIRYTAPVYLKFGVRNAPNIYPGGYHLETTAVALGRERVRRAVTFR